MPQYRNPFEKGDLFIKFDVQFPDNNWLSPEKLTVRQNVHQKLHFTVQKFGVSKKLSLPIECILAQRHDDTNNCKLTFYSKNPEQMYHVLQKN